MASLLYRNFLIVSAADRDTSEAVWIPLACVHWTNSNGRRAYHFFTDIHERFDNANDAVTFGIQTAQQWIDKYNQNLSNPDSRES
jgi:hypothetical protein